MGIWQRNANIVENFTMKHIVEPLTMGAPLALSVLKQRKLRKNAKKMRDNGKSKGAESLW